MTEENLKKKNERERERDTQEEISFQAFLWGLGISVLILHIFMGFNTLYLAK